MPDPTVSASLQRLDELTPDARKRVQDSLKAHIETELGRAGVSGLNKAAEFSRGVIFSRSRPTAMLDNEQEIIKNAGAMDEASFGQFVKNLSQLKTPRTGS